MFLAGMFDQGMKVTTSLGEQEGRKLGYRKWFTFFSFPRRKEGENSKGIHFKEVPAPRNVMSSAFSQQRLTQTLLKAANRELIGPPRQGTMALPCLFKLSNVDLTGQKITLHEENKHIKNKLIGKLLTLILKYKMLIKQTRIDTSNMSQTKMSQIPFQITYQ